MRSTTQRSGTGRHRKITPSQTAKGRMALFTVAAGAVSSAGVGGAAAASLQSNAPATPNVQLASTSNPLEKAQPELAEAPLDAAPQVLTMAEAKPVTNLTEQLEKAIEASVARAAADDAARAPSVSLPAVGVLTSPFGPRWGSFHSGIDIANANGTPILAVMDGTVIDSGPASGYGNWIRIQHEDGSISVYGHMESLDVTVGQHVVAGQKIAGMGNLGFSTGTHLHFEIHPDGTNAVDPAAWLASRGISV
ncbi:M23 family metallopeptidase [Corynebacterium lizhenjunii]|uniref:M23 family metallopeptidase n=1 Tax=Corynebacterium lizhenjunii TaxID=2709394 RepID=A0A7T0KFU8_9CORY|nr:M23 family metallopeptidase [Corynebacterium lizhenjunii]QPK79784.1 M23 family metallopeptidase [Corynebacterium lizhenjunii]